MTDKERARRVKLMRDSSLTLLEHVHGTDVVDYESSERILNIGIASLTPDERKEVRKLLIKILKRKP